MYAREVDGQELKLAVSGKLWNQSLVMIDSPTKSLWSHILGKAMSGKLKGKELEQIPSVMTDWQSFAEDHPDSTVVYIARSSKNYTVDFYEAMGGQLQNFILGIVQDDGKTAWSLDYLKKNPLIDTELHGEPVLVAFHEPSATARLYKRTLGKRVLDFEIKEKKFIDKQTGTVWSPTSGRGISGSLKGQYLTPLPAIMSFRNVWMNFHPKTKLHTIPFKKDGSATK